MMHVKGYLNCPPGIVVSSLELMGEWSFLTNHARVLLAIAQDPALTVREIADSAGVTERAVHTIIGELEQSGYLTRRRVGRRNVYALHPDRPIRGYEGNGRRVGELLTILLRHDKPAELAFVPRAAKDAPPRGVERRAREKRPA
jgi:DNA-binding transcriptional ArsR family regulator